MTRDASRLTCASKQEIMTEPGVRNPRVAVYALNKSKEFHERLQPQGGRSFRAYQQVSSRGRRHSGKGNSGAIRSSERRSRTGGPPAFHESATGSGGEAGTARGLHGKESSSQVRTVSFGHAERGPSRAVAIAFVIFLISFLLTGCGEHKQARVDVPPPPPMSAPDSQTSAASPEPSTKTIVPVQPDEDPLRIPADAKPISVETGLASWYGGPYHNRRGSNGEIYNMHAMTAAHRTLPLESIVRVTNVKTGSAVLLRITDRGPFIEGRVLDLSEAAAKKIDVWQAGVAMVRIEVLRTPSSL